MPGLRGAERSLGMDLTRRELIRRTGILVAGGALVPGGIRRAVAGTTSPNRPGGAGARGGPPPTSRKVPLIHTTDLYDPPQDPDDQIDLATVFALEEYDVRGVVLDVTEKFLHPEPEGWDIARRPGSASVMAMERLTGRSIPVAQGPHHPLVDPRDTCEDAPEEEQSGIQLILQLLEASPEPVVISVTGSPRALTAANNREPALLREKTRAVLLNAGSTGGPKVEWNVGLDPRAFIGLWRSDLPILWFPPGTDTGAFDPADGRGTYYRAPQAELFEDLSPALRSYLADTLTGALPSGASHTPAEDDTRWRSILRQTRNLWCTASLVMGAGRVLAEAERGWRFVPTEALGSGTVWPWRLDPIRASVDAEGRVHWGTTKADTGRWIFGRAPGSGFGHAMTEALNALLGEMERR
jgi:hypothetical protein